MLGRCLTRKYAPATFPKTWKAANQWIRYSSNDYSEQFLHSPLYLFASALWIQSDGPTDMSSENVPHVPYSPVSLPQFHNCFGRNK